MQGLDYPDRFCEACKRLMPVHYKADGVRTTGRARHLSRRFCSRQCQGVAMMLSSAYTPGASRVQARKYVIAKHAPTTCGRCGEKKPIDIHHIDENPLNNRPENLEILCRKCHLRHHRDQEKLRRPKCRFCDSISTHRVGQVCDKCWMNVRYNGSLELNKEVFQGSRATFRRCRRDKCNKRAMGNKKFCHAHQETSVRWAKYGKHRPPSRQSKARDC